MMSATPFRVLVIDDTPAIHDDYRKVLCACSSAVAAVEVSKMEALIFGPDGNATGDTGGAADASFSLDSAFQGRDGIEKLRQAIGERRPYAMAFVDMRMPPGLDGVQTIREMWKIDPKLQIVICTAYSDYTPEQISRELAIDGRILTLRKPFEAAEVKQLARTLCDKWQMSRRSEELERLVEARTADLKRAALTDALTGLPNRALFCDRVDSAMRRGKRDPNYKFAVLFFDVDRFKVINDSLGHEAGDQILLNIAERLTQSLRDPDTVARVDADSTMAESVIGSAAGVTAAAMAARLGGDEFTIILENIRADADAARVAQRLLEVCSKPYSIGGHTVHSTVSIGITTSSVGYERTEDMLRDADTAMYHAKREGRGRFSVFDEAMHKDAVARLTFESDLRTAVAQGHIQLNYQPIVDMKTERLIGFEALARWRHPERGWIPPMEFIPLAEDTGAIIPMGLHVFEQACRQLSAWQARHPDLSHLTMSINVSRKQLTHPEFVDQVAQIMRDTGVNPPNIKIEITESSVMTDATASLRALRRLRELNVQLHIDDFGTGYSSLSCLQTFPLTGLKIDREFVKEVTEKPEQAAIIRTIIALAHALNIPLVAEGVETPEQTAALRALGCDHAQGYLFAKPMDTAAAGQYIDKLQQVAAAA